MPWPTYTIHKLRTVVTMPWWQHAPYSSPVQHSTITTSDGIRLGATLWQTGKPALLVICHGFASNQGCLGLVWLAETLAGHYDVLTFDWRGYARSEGHSSLGGAEALDLAAVLSYARSLGYQQVGLVGESMGGLIVLATLGAAASGKLPHLAADLRVEAVATLAAPVDLAMTGPPRPLLLRRLAPQRWARPLAPLGGFRLGPLQLVYPLDLVRAIRVPLLLIHGTADGIVPVQSAYLLHERVPAATLRIYQGVWHGVEAMRLQAPRRLLNDLDTHFAPLRGAATP